MHGFAKSLLEYATGKISFAQTDTHISMDAGSPLFTCENKDCQVVKSVYRFVFINLSGAGDMWSRSYVLRQLHRSWNSRLILSIIINKCKVNKKFQFTQMNITCHMTSEGYEKLYCLFCNLMLNRVLCSGVLNRNWAWFLTAFSNNVAISRRGTQTIGFTLCVSVGMKHFTLEATLLLDCQAG